MERALTKKEATRRRIVDTAARVVRLKGCDGVGVADVMRQAGLTHGGFYAHFPSREALLVEAIERAGRGSAAAMARRIEASTDVTPFRAFVEAYLADAQLKAVDGGCPVAALASEIPRQPDAVRRAATVRVKAFVQRVESLLPPSVAPAEAPVVVATLVGALQVARAIGGAEKGRQVLAQARDALLRRYDPA